MNNYKDRSCVETYCVLVLFWINLLMHKAYLARKEIESRHKEDQHCSAITSCSFYFFIGKKYVIHYIIYYENNFRK